MNESKQGKSVRGSLSGRPIMALFDLLGRRWTMRILWELNQADRTFRELQEKCGNVSPTMINKRLKELRDVQLVTLKETSGYTLTPRARELMQLMQPMRNWSETWAGDLIK